jgi:uncharacterized membrane protein YfcA
MIQDPFFYLCAIPAVLIFGIAKGGFGGGIAVISVPLMALAVSPVQAAAILLPVLVVMDVVALWSFRGKWDKQNLRFTLPGAIAGIVVGSLVFRYLNDDMIRILIATIALIFCANYYFGSKTPEPRPASVGRGTFWGAVAGFTSFGIHAGGPPLSVYMLPQQLEKTRLMGTFAIFFATVNAIKLIPYTWLGQFNSQNLLTSLILIPLAPVGVRLGYFLLHKVSERLIYQLCYFFLGIVGVKLLLEGSYGLIIGS